MKPLAETHRGTDRSPALIMLCGKTLVPFQPKLFKVYFNVLGG